MSKVVAMDSPDDMKPTIDLNTKNFPTIKNWEVGKDYTISVKVHVTRKQQGGYGRPDNFFSICGEVSKAEEE